MVSIVKTFKYPYKGVPIFYCKVTFKDHLELLGNGEFISLALRINFTLNVFGSCSSRKQWHTPMSLQMMSAPSMRFFLVLAI